MPELQHWHIHSKAGQMKFLLILLHLGILFLIARWVNKKWNKAHFALYWSALAYHVFFGIAVGLVYLFYYTYDDTWTYFRDAEKLADFARSDFNSYVKALFDADSTIANYITISSEEWRSVFFVKILSVFCLLSGSNYWICACYLSLISFFSSWNLHKVICSWKPKANFASAFAFLFFPSVVFWGSGIEKETLAIASVFFLAACLIRFAMHEKLNLVSWVLILLSLFLVWKLRYFWLAVLLLVGIPTVIGLYLTRKKIANYKILLSALATLVIVLVFVPLIHPNFSFDIFLQVMVQNNRELVGLSDSRHIIHFHQLTPNWGSVIVNAPLALFSGLFRPFIWEAPSLMGLFASIENFLLLVMTVLLFLNIKQLLHSKNRVLLLGALAYIAILCTFLALSTPNFGSLSRYRIGFLPFFVLIISYKNLLMLSVEQFVRKRLQ